MKISPFFALLACLSFHSAHAKDIRVDIATPTNLESNCSEDQIKDQFFQALRPLSTLKAPASQLLGFQQGACRIYGMLKKTNSGYEFQPNYGQLGATKPVMTFHSLSEIVQLVKATQNPSAQASASDKPAATGDSSSTSYDPSLSMPRRTNTENYSKSESPAPNAPTPGAESLAGPNPWLRVPGAR